MTEYFNNAYMRGKVTSDKSFWTNADGKTKDCYFSIETGIASSSKVFDITVCIKSSYEDLDKIKIGTMVIVSGSLYPMKDTLIVKAHQIYIGGKVQ